MSLKLFQDCTDTELKAIYEQIIQRREDGLRPRILDPYIEKVRKAYPLSFGEGWTYAEKEFWDEAGRRFFSNVKDERLPSDNKTLYTALKETNTVQEAAELLSNICWTCSDCSSDGREQCMECILSQLKKPACGRSCN